MKENRWPPIYDFDDLKCQIKELQLNKSLFLQYYSISPQTSYCQGDIISFDAEFPYITTSGDIAIDEHPFSYWLIIGNTCDLARPIENEPFTNIIPLQEVPPSIPEQYLESLQQYIPYKKFYIPSWEKEPNSYGFVADFTKMATIEKSVLLSEQTTKIREMNKLSWFLLHSCIVRYLARDDGRND